jgi:quercetin dioxygenase-like cupin family protein
LKTGDLYLIPANVEHSVKTNTDPVRILDIFSPVREDFKY